MMDGDYIVLMISTIAGLSGAIIYTNKQLLKLLLKELRDIKYELKRQNEILVNHYNIQYVKREHRG